MRDITKFLGDIPEMKPQETLKQLVERLDKACCAAEPDPKKRGPVFSVGETLNIRGGKFRVEEIRTDGLFLKGVPSI